MCGLCGVISTRLTRLEIEAFQQLMVVSTLRGYYGAGIAMVPMDGKKEIDVLKTAEECAAWLAYDVDFWKRAFKTENPYTIFMGHARQPTKGGYELADAHPHVFDKIIGCHNGTMTMVGGKKIPDKAKKHETLFSDSFYLFKSVEEQGIDAALKHSAGSYAISYIDKSNNTLNFIRNAQRSLYWAQVQGIDSIFWASEDDFLKLVLKRNFPTQAVRLWTAPVDTLVSFSLRPFNYVGYINKRALSQDKEPVIQSVNASMTSVPLLPPPPSAVEDVVSYVTVPGHCVTRTELDLLLQQGCAYCNRQAQLVDYLKRRIYWTQSEEFVCHDCAVYDTTARDYVTSFGLHVPKAQH